MAATTADTLRERIAAVLKFNKEKLITRKEDWGTINFETGRASFDRIFEITETLNVLPFESLLDNTITSISNTLNNTLNIFREIDSFRIDATRTDQQPPINVRNKHLETLKTNADALFTATAQWIPYLAYKKGDVSENIGQLQKSIRDGKALVEKATDDIQKQAQQMADIIAAARQASAGAGVAVFHTDFETEATNLSKKAQNWLRMTEILASFTVVVAVAFYFIAEPSSDIRHIAQLLTTKLAVLAVLISATVWCGRIYKALMHQSAVYKFKALGLRTFQAFSQGASNPATKDTVLTETTKSIFSNHQTGYIGDSPSSESDLKIVEVVKSVFPNDPNRG